MNSQQTWHNGRRLRLACASFSTTCGVPSLFGTSIDGLALQFILAFSHMFDSKKLRQRRNSTSLTCLHFTSKQSYESWACNTFIVVMCEWLIFPVIFFSPRVCGNEGAHGRDHGWCGWCTWVRGPTDVCACVDACACICKQGPVCMYVFMYVHACACVFSKSGECVLVHPVSVPGKQHDHCNSPLH